MFRWSSALPWLAAALLALPAQAAPPDARALQARRAALADELAHSPFGRPIVLHADASERAPSGAVDAVLDQRFQAVSAALRRPADWCEVLRLQTNVRRCSAAGDRLDVAIARRLADPDDAAQAMTFRFALGAARPDLLAVTLQADDGPLGTHDYRLAFDAVPTGERTFVHLSYGYRAGLLARVATRAYLDGPGRDKVGFSIAGRDAAGRPEHVRGIQGVAERNVMRYFLAIEAVLATQDLPPGERLRRRLERFHAALERYPAQLHETTLAEYLALKQRAAP